MILFFLHHMERVLLANTIHYTIRGWPCRTTVGYRDGVGWQVIELRQSVFQLHDRTATISGRYSKGITMLSKQIVSVVDFGMALTDTSPVQPSSSVASASSTTYVAMAAPGSALHEINRRRVVLPVLQQMSTNLKTRYSNRPYVDTS